jgi:hypothetical protein
MVQETVDSIIEQVANLDTPQAAFSEMTDADAVYASVGEISEAQDSRNAEPASESGQESHTAEEVDEETMGDAIHSCEAVATECVAQRNVHQPNVDISNNAIAEHQIQQVDDTRALEMSPPTPLTSANTHHLMEEPSHLQYSGNDQIENVETRPVSCSEAALGMEVEQEPATQAQGELDASEGSVQIQDDNPADTLFTLDEFEEEMNRQRELDDVEEREAEERREDNGAGADEHGPPR